jgi:hypothetical protein
LALYISDRPSTHPFFLHLDAGGVQAEEKREKGFYGMLF